MDPDGKELSVQSALKLVSQGVKLALLPPFQPLETISTSDGPAFGRVYSDEVRSFVLKSAGDDDYVLCGQTGKLVLHIDGSEDDGATSCCGLHDMVDFKVRKKTISLHGRFLVEGEEGKAYFNVSKEKNSKFVAHRGRGHEALEGYMVIPENTDISATSITLAMANSKGQFLSVAREVKRSLIKSGPFKGGTELQLDVAPGVDWTAILALYVAFFRLLVSVASQKNQEDTSHTTSSPTVKHSDSFNEDMGLILGLINTAASVTGDSGCDIM